LDETHREPLILQVLLGFSTEEITRIMGIGQEPCSRGYARPGEA
jgi:DNA-directed RNA polymerase specialized sigma24 family protein